MRTRRNGGAISNPRGMGQRYAHINGSWIPLPPSILPVVIVQGSEYEMGFQYGQQIGEYIEPVRDSAWVQGLKRMGSRKAILTEIKAAERYIQKYAPEEIERMNGIADGASKAGWDISYIDVLLINTNVRSPTSTAAHPCPPEGLSSEGCSVWAAWGSTTKDGSLICGDSKDEDYSYQVLTVAFPDHGNRYMVSGRAGELGQHFAMNCKGLFIGASGAPGERDIDRDYGIPYSCTFSHLIQFANNGVEAREMLASWKVYWDRGLNFTFADVHRQISVLEMTAALQSVRLPGQLGETDFIFATNNFLTEAMNPATIGTPFGHNSPPRNEELFFFLSRYQGKVDLDFAKMMWRHPGYQQICNLYNHRVAILLPREGDGGEAHVCTGPANREAYPTYASGPGPYPGRSNSPARVGHDYLITPTYSFYRIVLASNPAEVVEAANDSAHDTNAMAYQEFRKLSYSDPGYGPLNEIYSLAVAERFEGIIGQNKGLLGKGNKALYCLGQAATAFARSQAHALQVYEALVPPATRPRDLCLPEDGRNP